MRVALISQEGGGISSVSDGLAHALSKKQIFTTIFTGTSETLKVKKINKYIEKIYLPILNIPPESIWFQLQNLRTLLEVFKNYDIVHGVSPEASVIFSFIGKRMEKPFITTIHGCARALQTEITNSFVFGWTLNEIGTDIFKYPFHNIVTRRSIINSDHAVICNYTVFNELKYYYKLDMKNCSVIYNGINFREINDVKVNSNRYESDDVIIYAGRLFAPKGIMYLLKAFKHLNQDIKTARLKIFGSGPLEQNIKKFIVNHGLSDNIEYKGFVPHKKLLVEIKKSDIVVLPSIYEAQPMFALEAMACKKPIVVFNASFAYELLPNMERGVHAKHHDYVDLSAKIKLLLLDKKLRSKISENAYKYVKQKHNWDIQVEKYLEVYQKASSKK